MTPRPEPIPSALVVVDAVRRLACVPDGTALDLGGVARMWSADRAAAIVRTLSDDPAILLEVGDDMVAVRGDHLVAVSSGDDDTGARAVVLRDGYALARARPGARCSGRTTTAAAHHLIDPATGAPADPASAVVIASDAAEADALCDRHGGAPLARLAPHHDLRDGARRRGERHTAAWEAVAV